MPRGRKKKSPVAESNTNVNSLSESSKKAIDELYDQLDELLKKTQLSKARLAVNIGMTYPGFLLAYKKKGLKLRTWLDIADFLYLPLNVGFEKKGVKAVQEAAPPVASGGESFLDLKLQNAEEKVAILERHMSFLEKQINRMDQP